MNIVEYKIKIRGIGAVIGHEITHGFDDNGRQFDKDGNRVLWWSSETIEKFIERKTCIVNQYSNYTVTQINLAVKISNFRI
jgi:predicted metalloendopeptidase